jgi:hypothetical protein
MVSVTTTGAPATDTEPARVRLDRPVLVGNLVSGALCLSPFAFVSPFLFLSGAAYVVAGAVFLAAIYGRGVRSWKQEAWAWAVPWLVAAALWAWILSGVSLSPSYLVCLGPGLLIATPCYLAWQIVALAVRQFIAWRSGRSSLPI